jgi:hypothetical protein
MIGAVSANVAIRLSGVKRRRYRRGRDSLAGLCKHLKWVERLFQLAFGQGPNGVFMDRASKSASGRIAQASFI